jgi:mRNA-degrading endonuclease RelE of RelBE toxin-antitoxin system
VAELRLTRRARTDLEQLPPQIQQAVLATLDRLAIEPTLGKPLIGRLRGLWSARVGAYRVLYTVEGSLVIVRAIRHRGVAYGG